MYTKYALRASNSARLLQGASDGAVHLTSAGIPLPVFRGMKLLAPSIFRLCNVVLSALEEEDVATVNAVEDLRATTLGMLKNRRACSIEELERLHSALSLQEDIFNGMFKCGEEAVAGRKKAKTELKEAVEANRKASVIENLTANEENSYRNIRQFVQWCTIAKKAKDNLQTRCNEEEMALSEVENDIQEVEALHVSGTRTADSRSSDVEAFMLFVSSKVDSTVSG